MNFFKNLFGKQEPQNKPKEEETLTPEQFFNSDYIKNLLVKYKRPTTLLRSRKSDISLGENESKFGGAPHPGGFDSYPCCDLCKTPLNFVLQLFKKDFPDFYFPNHSVLFQLFRCPNMDCEGAFLDHSDHKMFHYYWEQTQGNKILIKPKHQSEDVEDEVPECYLKPSVTEDFPNYDDYEGEDFNEIEDRFGSDLTELFIETHSAIQNTKYGGYPSYTQSPAYPECACGKTKEFFFQLASEEMEDNIGSGAKTKWSPHGIMIGDVGNIYYYVCKSCGPDTIESNWDCY